VKSSGIPPFANSAKDGAPDPLWLGKSEGAQWRDCGFFSLPPTTMRNAPFENCPDCLFS
jgi:hypothetical protein